MTTGIERLDAPKIIEDARQDYIKTEDVLGGGCGPGTANPAHNHGMRSKAHVENRKYINELTRQFRDLGGLI